TAGISRVQSGRCAAPSSPTPCSPWRRSSSDAPTRVWATPRTHAARTSTHCACSPPWATRRPGCSLRSRRTTSPPPAASGCAGSPAARNSGTGGAFRVYYRRMRRTLRLAALAALTSSLAPAATLARPDAAATEIHGPQDVPTPQLAIAAAEPGDTIVLDRGTYPGGNVVPPGKPDLTIVGVDRNEL